MHKRTLLYCIDEQRECANTAHIFTNPIVRNKLALRVALFSKVFFSAISPSVDTVG